MIDTNGQIYYLDFDRMIDRKTGDLIEKPDVKRIAECQNHLNALSQHIDVYIFQCCGVAFIHAQVCNYMEMDNWIHLKVIIQKILATSKY